jgi:hypothetical protein
VCFMYEVVPSEPHIGRLVPLCTRRAELLFLFVARGCGQFEFSRLVSYAVELTRFLVFASLWLKGFVEGPLRLQTLASVPLRHRSMIEVRLLLADLHLRYRRASQKIEEKLFPSLDQSSLSARYF